MKKIAAKVDIKATRDQLALPEKQLQQLQQIVDEVAKQRKASKPRSGRDRLIKETGVIALFAGASGTGKTMAAEVVANELGLGLFIIDLASVVSKFIGETEKNLEKVFDYANKGRAILFFDEADALFGKRSQVKDSHDRYANIEISYLLQRIEAFPGLAILTTNMKSALDESFLRRIRHVVNFPVPDKSERIST